MLKVEYGVIGGKGFVALEMEKGDREILIEVAKENPKFFATNGCGINVQEILQGKICLPCDEGQFKRVEEAVIQFNTQYFNEYDLEELKAENVNLTEQIDKLSKENKYLRDKLERVEFALKGYIFNDK